MTRFANLKISEPMSLDRAIALADKQMAPEPDINQQVKVFGDPPRLPVAAGESLRMVDRSIDIDKIAKEALEDTKSSPRRWADAQQFEQSYKQNFYARVGQDERYKNIPKDILLQQARSNRKLQNAIASAVRDANEDANDYSKTRATAGSSDAAIREWTLQDAARANAAVRGDVTSRVTGSKITAGEGMLQVFEEPVVGTDLDSQMLNDCILERMKAHPEESTVQAWKAVWQELFGDKQGSEPLKSKQAKKLLR